METHTPRDPDAHHGVGRPRRETMQDRNNALIAAATRVFMREGYGDASIDKIASEAGVSTRTIYQRYKNKSELWVAAFTRLVDRDAAHFLSPIELDRLDIRDALIAIGRAIADRARNVEAASLFRILATEAVRFPELAAKMRENTKQRIDDAIETYLRVQASRHVLRLADPRRAASLFVQMICAEMHERFLFGSCVEGSAIDYSEHVTHAVDIFLCGALARVNPLICDHAGSAK